MWPRLFSPRAWLIGTGLSVALMSIAGVVAPSMAEDSLEQDLGIIRACGSDVWSLCSGVLPDVGRVKACIQDKMGQLSKGCIDKHRGYDVPGLRQARAEGANHLFLPYHSGQVWRRRARLSNPRALSLRQVLLPVLQSRHRHQPHGFDDLCRRSGWHSSGSGGPAQRQGRARQRVSGVSPARL